MGPQESQGPPPQPAIARSIDVPYGNTAPVTEHWVGAVRVHSWPYGTCGCVAF